MRRGKRRRRRKTKSMTKAKKKQKGDDALTATKSEIQGNTVSGVPFSGDLCPQTDSKKEDVGEEGDGKTSLNEVGMQRVIQEVGENDIHTNLTLICLITVSLMILIILTKLTNQ